MASALGGDIKNVAAIRSTKTGKEKRKHVFADWGVHLRDVVVRAGAETSRMKNKR